MLPYLGYALLGLIAGFASGCFGIGGGAIVVPALILFFKMPYHAAIGTSLAIMIPVALSGSITNHTLGNLDYKVVAACAIAGVIGAILGVLFIQHIPPLYARRGFAIFLLYAAWRLWFK